MVTFNAQRAEATRANQYQIGAQQNKISLGKVYRGSNGDENLPDLATDDEIARIGHQELIRKESKASRQAKARETGSGTSYGFQVNPVDSVKTVVLV